MPTKAIYATGTSLQLFLRPYGAGDSMGQLSQDCVVTATLARQGRGNVPSVPGFPGFVCPRVFRPRKIRQSRLVLLSKRNDLREVVFPEKNDIPRKDTRLKAQPFLKWAGGKRKLLPLLVSHLPEDIDERRYVEPFLGAGSLFFQVGPASALLSDANPFLIAAYEGIRDHADAVLRELKRHIDHHSRRHYYQTREAYNKLRHSAAQTARFIYLNKTCFNGIFRVNARGEFNVPKGSKDRPSLPSRAEFRAIAGALSCAVLSSADFSATFAKVVDSDFVYLDPPYPALNLTAFFAHYTADRFDSKAQERLADEVKRDHNLGASFLMSNADVESIRSLYAGFDMVSVPVQRYVSCKGKRVQVSELLIKNY